jgi:nucleotide-binding universal stress UspA family protein
MKSILVPLDGTNTAERTLSFLEQVSNPGDKVVLLSVQKPEAPVKSGSLPGQVVRGGFAPAGGVTGLVTPPTPVYRETDDQSFERQIHHAMDYLEGLAAPLRKTGLEIRTEVRLDEHPAEAIIAYARDMRPTFITMLRRTRFGLGELLFGNVATRVIESEVAPVLLVPPKQ